ncbi:MAG: transglutaminase-like domain-containing protein [Pseudomonadota bacterium]|nr:transglutaminase-like domain-containing protein [Pseudomonadota bacterium]
MDRRAFLLASSAATVASMAPFGRMAWAADDQWRTFEITTLVQLTGAAPAGVWIPVPTVNTDYQKVLGTTFKTEGKAEIVQDPAYGAGILVAQFSGEQKPVVEVTSRISTRNRRVDLSAAPGTVQLDADQRKHYLAGTELVATDGIVRQTALEITKGAHTDLEKTRAIYEWIVDNTYRDPKVRGCGVGDIKAMLETKNLGGKCGDLNALFVGLSRAVGVPARDVYGIRVADSALGYKSLGKSGEITKAQHCRAEFFLAGYGWVPVDPADVRKVMLEENGGLPITDAKVEAARKRLFGSWEMNWMAYNYAADVQLPGDPKGKVGFFMYPNATVNEDGKPGRVDSLDPDHFKYSITSREIVA